MIDGWAQLSIGQEVNTSAVLRRLWLETTTLWKMAALNSRYFGLIFIRLEEAATIFICVYVLEQLCCEECRTSPSENLRHELPETILLSSLLSPMPNSLPNLPNFCLQPWFFGGKKNVWHSWHTLNTHVRLPHTFGLPTRPLSPSGGGSAGDTIQANKLRREVTAAYWTDSTTESLHFELGVGLMSCEIREAVN